MITDDQLPVRIPGHTLRLAGELSPIDEGWFGTGQHTPPSEHTATGHRPSDALLQRTLTGLQCHLHAAEPDSDPSRQRQ